MKFNSKSGLYTASNVSYDPRTQEARSYAWWSFVRVIRGGLVFNTHPYSNTTIKHQYKVRKLLLELGVSIRLEVNTRKSLSEFSTLAELFRADADQSESDAEAREEKRKAKLLKAKQRRLDAKLKGRAA